VDKVHADFTGIQVKQNDHLVDIYSPDLYVAQNELIRSLDALEKTTGDRTFAQANVEAARTKLRLLGLLPEQLAEIEKSKQVKTHLTVYAPIGGTVIEKTVRPGQYVKEGDPLYRIADLDPIWLYLDVYESDLPWVRYGQAVDVGLEAYPGEPFRGTVMFIDPFLDDKTRTVRVRVNLKNPERKLKPAMYASAVIRARLRADGTPEPTGLEGKYICPMHPEVVRDGPGKCTVCGMDLERVPDLRPVRPPTKGGHDHGDHSWHDHPPADAGGPPPGQVLAVRATAVLSTGRRTIAYRKRPDAAYELVEVTVGPLAEGRDDAGRPAAYYPVLGGLKPGDRVAVRGGFLLDSQRQIEGMPSLLDPGGQAPANPHAGHGDPAPAAAPGGGHKH
jgi:Cu(I)/Ag(I) efflux system membrane fusion protein